MVEIGSEFRLSGSRVRFPNHCAILPLQRLGQRPLCGRGDTLEDRSCANANPPTPSVNLDRAVYALHAGLKTINVQKIPRKNKVEDY